MTELSNSRASGTAHTTAAAAPAKRVVFLDALRFIAAAAVVFQHVAEQSGAFGGQLVGLLSPGVFGVVLFFIVSGFVIPMSARKTFDIRTFAIRRVFRIYPLILVTFAILAVLAFSGLVPAFAYARNVSGFDWIANLLLVQDYVSATPLWGVTWTLSLEVVWYVLFAVSLQFLGPNFDNKLSIIFPIVMVALALASMAIGHRLPLGRIGMIYAAVLGCRIWRNQMGVVTQRRLLLDVAAFIVALAIANIISFGYFKHPNLTMNQALYPWIAAPLLFVAVTLVPAIRHSGFVNSRLIAWLGTISFSTYLLHPLALGLAESTGYFTIVALVLTLVFSVLGYYLVEVPGQTLGAFMSRRRDRVAPMARLDSSSA